MSTPSLSPNLKLLKTLGDETRLKILYTLKHHELSVSELVKVIEQQQSNISRHLNQLRDIKLVDDRKDGTLCLCRWSDVLKGDVIMRTFVEQILATLGETNKIDDAIQDVLADRRLSSSNFFDRIAGRYKDLAQPGGSIWALLHAVSSLSHWGKVVDLGCGEGDLSLLFAPSAEELIAVDQSQAMLNIIDQRAKEKNISNITTLHGDAEKLEIESSSVDLIILSQTLHHTADPKNSIQELHRVLKPGGNFLILDLPYHGEEWMRDRMGDQWLGFDPKEILSWLEEFNLKTKQHQIITQENTLPIMYFSGNKK